MVERSMDALKEMERGMGRQEALKRMRKVLKGDLSRQDVAKRLVELAYGPANDCVKLVLEGQPEVEALDLSLLRQVKRSERGAIEVELVDRLAALKLLGEMLGNGAGEGADFLAALGAGDG